MDNDKRFIANIKKITTGFFFLVLSAVIFFIIACRFNITRVWFYAILSFVYFMISLSIVIKLRYKTINLTGARWQVTKTWDKAFLAVYLPTVCVVFIVAWLDVVRFKWSRMGSQYLIIGSLIFMAATIFAQWAMLVNPFFEPTARIQKERNQRVITAGPYKIIRHPGYLGAIIANLSIPLILGSRFALIPEGIIIILFIIRTALEDKMLRNELDGYSEYAKTVKYRLLPGIW